MAKLAVRGCLKRATTNSRAERERRKPRDEDREGPRCPRRQSEHQPARRQSTDMS